MVVRVSTNEAEQPAEDEDYQLRSDLKSVARTMLEGKPLLREDAQEVQEEMERERFFGRIAVLGLGVRYSTVCMDQATIVLPSACRPVSELHGRGPAWLQAVLIGERITGKGVVQALDHAVGVPLWEIEPLLGLLVLSLLWGALYPRKQLAPAAQAEAAQATGRNWVADAQVLVRRLACVALAVAIVAETISGKVNLTRFSSFPVATKEVYLGCSRSACLGTASNCLLVKQLW